MNKIVKQAIFNASVTVLYIVLVILFISNAERLQISNEKTIIQPIFMLLLFVFSATLTGSLILGQPAMLFIEGKKKEAIIMLSLTLGALFISLLIVLIILLVF